MTFCINQFLVFLSVLNFCAGIDSYAHKPATPHHHPPHVVGERLSLVEQSWALSVFFNFFNNKKMIFFHFLSS